MDGEPGRAEHAEHRLVVGQHLGAEASQTVEPAEGGEVLEQHRRQAASVVSIFDGERDLGLVASGPPVVAADGDDVVTEQRDERYPVDTIDVREAMDLVGRERRLHGEEPVVAALRRQASVEGDESIGIARTDRPEVDGAPVGKRDVG